MASQVLSGASNPIYTNNTGQNVRVVINYMASATSARQLSGVEAGRALDAAIAALVASGIPRSIATVSATQFATVNTIAINWAGVSAVSSTESGPIAIGRNLAYSQAIVQDAQGTVQTVATSSQFVGGRPGITVGFAPVAADVAIAAAAVANNASGFGVSLPTELMLAPGQTFSAVCNVYNIVVIPELG